MTVTPLEKSGGGCLCATIDNNNCSRPHDLFQDVWKMSGLADCLFAVK